MSILSRPISFIAYAIVGIILLEINYLQHVVASKITSLPQTLFPTPKGYTRCSKDGACRIYKPKMGWEDARDRCMSDGGYLANIDTPEKVDWIKKKSQRIRNNMWTGSYKPMNETQWFRADNGLPITFSFEENMENLSEPVCGVLAKGFRIIGELCTQKRPFVCEISYGRKSSPLETPHVYPGSDSAYKIENDKLTFEEAENRCMSHGGHLAIIDTKKKIKFLNIIGLNDDQLYVGFHKSAHSEEWHRVDDNSPVPSLPWISQPETESIFECTVTNRHGLSPTHCDWKYKGICEIPNSVNETSSVGRK